MQIEPTTYDRAVAGATAGLTRSAGPLVESERDEAASVGFGKGNDRGKPAGHPKLLGAAEALPGQGKAERSPRLDELLSARSVLPPISPASEASSGAAQDSVD